MTVGTAKIVGARWKIIKLRNMRASGVRGSNLGGREVSFTVQTYSSSQPASFTMGLGTFPGLKWPERGADHPSPSSAEIKNE